MKKLVQVSFLFLLLFSIKCKNPPIEPEIASIQTNQALSVNSNSAQIEGEITELGSEQIIQYGHCWDTFSNPTVDDSCTQFGSTENLEVFTSNLTGLSYSTRYYVRSYLTTTAETIYGNEVTLTTNVAVIPSITTSTVSDIGYNTSICGGSVMENDYPITARGVCYSTHSNPDLNDFYTIDSSGTGTFSSNLTYLEYETTYYVRAYATNIIGTAYGEEQIFTTIDLPNYPYELIFVQGGSFQMGCGTGQPDCLNNETPVHTVILDDFHIGIKEITNQQFADFLNIINVNSDGYYNNVPYIKIEETTCQIYYSDEFYVDNGKENYPVINVTWFGAVSFCEFYGGRLPTEAEWEYAARGGINYTDYFTYSGSNNIDDVAWYGGNQTHEVGTKHANQLNIYDMTGNVQEMCSDWADDNYYYISPINNPQGPDVPIGGNFKISRGADYSSSYFFARVPIRQRISAFLGGGAIGFRFVK